MEQECGILENIMERAKENPDKQLHDKFVTKRRLALRTAAAAVSTKKVKQQERKECKNDPDNADDSDDRQQDIPAVLPIVIAPQSPNSGKSSTPRKKTPRKKTPATPKPATTTPTATPKKSTPAKPKPATATATPTRKKSTPAKPKPATATATPTPTPKKSTQGRKRKVDEDSNETTTEKTPEAKKPKKAKTLKSLLKGLNLTTSAGRHHSPPPPQLVSPETSEVIGSGESDISPPVLSPMDPKSPKRLTYGTLMDQFEMDRAMFVSREGTSAGMLNTTDKPKLR